MKTPETRVRFQAPSRHYHRHRVDDASEAWSRWIGGSTERKGSGSLRIVALWILAAVAFLAVLGVMCYQMF
jgi:hypothetical protein